MSSQPASVSLHRRAGAIAHSYTPNIHRCQAALFVSNRTVHIHPHRSPPQAPASPSQRRERLPSAHRYPSNQYCRSSSATSLHSSHTPTSHPPYPSPPLPLPLRPPPAPSHRPAVLRAETAGALLPDGLRAERAQNKGCAWGGQVGGAVLGGAEGGGMRWDAVGCGMGSWVGSWMGSWVES